jgi:hypothetical protein
VAPEGSACVAVSEFSQLWDTLTSYPQINMCLGPGHRTDASCVIFGCRPLAWGKANLFSGCTSCTSIQLVTMARFVLFTGESNREGIALQWQMDHPSPSGTFQVERATDTLDFHPVYSFETSDREVMVTYKYVDRSPLPGTSFYRIRYDGAGILKATWSPVIKVDRIPSMSVHTWPNPFTDRLYLHLPEKNGIVHITIASSAGRPIVDRDIKVVNGMHSILFPSSIPGGMYILSVTTPRRTWVQKLIKQ